MCVCVLSMKEQEGVDYSSMLKKMVSNEGINGYLYISDY